jgi:hypothetical protein
MQQGCVTTRLTGCADRPACTTVVVVSPGVNTGAINTHGLLGGDTLAPAQLADLACTQDQACMCAICSRESQRNMHKQ